MRVLLLIIPFIISLNGFTQVSKSIDTVLMGSSFTFTSVSSDDELNTNALRAGVEEVVRIETLISSWNPDSETSRINNNSGIEPTKVSLELFELIRRSKKISKISNGYFDISFAAMDTLWNFNASDLQIPDQESLDKLVHLVNFQNIILDINDTTVFLKYKGMKIGFGAIGKGYAANCAKKVMAGMGIESGIVNAGGDLLGWGTKPDGSAWMIGIQDPNRKLGVVMTIPIKNQAVVTSGNYERYVVINGKQYCHILNPKTGWPVENLKSVTIICADAELADALSTTVFILGRKLGMDLIDQLKDVECVLIDEQDDVHFSANINSNYLQNAN